MPNHYDALETRDPAARERELFARPARRFQRMRDRLRQPRKQLALARGGFAGFEGVVMVGHG